jgi:hypothetical protein
MSSPKELRYFTDNYERSDEWYFSHFEANATYSALGEFSTNYLYDDTCAEKIFTTLGRVKLICIIRDPVSRSLSHFKHLVRDGCIPKNSGEVSLPEYTRQLQKYPELIGNSLYRDAIEKFCNTFGRESLFIVTQDLCESHPKMVLKHLWRFLSVSGDFIPASSGRVIGQGVNPRLAWLENFRRMLFIKAKAHAPWVINLAKSSGLSAGYRILNRGEELFFSVNVVDYIGERCGADWRYCVDHYVNGIE